MNQNKCQYCGAKITANDKKCEYCYMPIKQNSEKNKVSFENINANDIQANNNKSTSSVKENSPEKPTNIPNFANIPYIINPNATSSSQVDYSKKTGKYIASLLCTIFAVLFMVFSVYYVFDIIDSANSEGLAILLLLLLSPFLYLTYLPAVGLSIVAIICSAGTISSSSKFFKASGIIMLIINIILAFAFLCFTLMLFTGII